MNELNKDIIVSTGVEKLLESVIPFGAKVLNRIEYRLLTEVLINKQDFGKLDKILGLPAERQRIVYVRAINKLKKHLNSVYKQTNSFE